MLCGKVKQGEREWEDRRKALLRGWRWSDRQGRRGAGCGRRAAWGRLRPGCGAWGFEAAGVAGAGGGSRKGWEMGMWPGREEC